MDVEAMKRELGRYMMFFKEEYGLPYEAFNDNDADYLVHKLMEVGKCHTTTV